MEFLVLLAFLILFGILFASWKTRKPLPYPPGPWGVPVFGNLLTMGLEPFKTFMEWKKIYGPIFSMQLGSYPAIVLNDERTIKLALGDPAFAGRPRIPLFVDAANGRGFAWSDGPEAMSQRKFVVKNLQKFLHGDKDVMETKMLAEIEESFEYLRQNSGEIIQMNHCFQRPILNSIWSLLIGKRFESGDPQFLTLTERLNKITSFDGILNQLSIVVNPISQFIPEFSGYNSIVRSIRDIYNFMENEFQRESRNRKHGNPENYTEAYMDKIEITADPETSFHKLSHCYKETTAELFIAVMETISSTIDFFFIHMLRNPNVCHAVQAEIQAEVGSHRHPCLADRYRLPYTQAAIYETLRFSPILPLSAYHRTIGDTLFEGYIIPNDTLVIPNLYAANHDPVVWGDPEVYRPERFLHETSLEMKKIDSILTFSYGKRICPGERLSNDFLLLYITNILQQFHVSLPTNLSLPSLETIPGLVCSPKHYNIVFTKQKLGRIE